MKYAWIDAERSNFELAEMCAVPEISVSGYRAWKRGGKHFRCPFPLPKPFSLDPALLFVYLLDYHFMLAILQYISLQDITRYMQPDQWHFARPRLAQAYLNYFGLGLSSARGLFARRRMGKTEFLKQDLIPAAAQAGYLTAYVNFWEDRRDPAIALVDVISFAVEPRGAAKLWEHLNRPLKKVKASGKMVGVVEGAIEADLTETARTSAGTVLLETMRQIDKKTARLLLVLDEAQVLAANKHSDFAHALRAALDIRKDKLKVVFAGSSETTLRRMFARPSEPFYNWAPLEPFDLLGKDFVEFMVVRVNSISKHELLIDDALLAFDALNRTPEFFRRYLERYLTYPFDGPAAALAYTKEHVFSSDEFRRQWQSLAPSDREVLAMLAEGIRDLHGKGARERIGKSLGMDKPSDLNAPRHALRRLQEANVLTKIGHGEYLFEDEVFGEWVRMGAQ